MNKENALIDYKYKIGLEVQFVREITQPACGDHPTFLLANQNDIGVIIGYSEIPNFEYPYKIQLKDDRTGSYIFYAKAEDFKLL